MSYNSLDYISKLNLESFDTLQFPSDQNDLASFTDSSFFDFDQFPISQDLKFENQQEFQNQVNQIPDENLSFELNKDTFKEPLPIEPKQTEPKQIQQQPEIKSESKISINSPSIPNDAYNEFDKKKRNTAASARFRIKKKLKEQEMEKNLNELKEKINQYNLKIQKLEMENKCLKSLIIEKNEQKSNDLLKQIKERSITRT
ncbi:hypothetical protein BN7_469 [Wickerhamomyces ciferrii]|uniref:BZIP domain-containing protein n=1 Tax=Wickerhamomyces ciferrii (strain ATCC 14091 / BCRC 22168 / CBS 111 / JCM 3599 / NBRC 0793 / NRRL Y-1031 F-60-10) TaxID=1206466 RepID=K0K7Z3_WICCF|nr:uncharacterized protein BN7_469 [Wickerhamomyces ciferrii]CCH40935.1 hypothetical protein BN7_469 [Wickerhamomyces ciferrii]